LKILFIAAEVAPFAKVGGLADVAESLPKALVEYGHEVIVAMPAYPMILKNKEWALSEKLRNYSFHLNPETELLATLHTLEEERVTFWFVECKNFFAGSKTSETLYTAPPEAYLAFSRALLEACRQLNWIPHVLHCNDWHTGFIPVLIKEDREHGFEKAASVFTIHNLAYQGEFGLEILDLVGLPRSLYTVEKVEAYGRVNFLKAGCSYANQINTVSPTYAKEIQTPEFGCRLEGLMRYLDENGRLRGILNGINVQKFNPKIDPSLCRNFSPDDLLCKRACKEYIQQTLRLPNHQGVPLLSMITRIDAQKGFDLLLQSIESLLELPIQLVILGTGRVEYIDKIKSSAKSRPNQVRFTERFDESLAHQIYAGTDMFLMPSLFEPCGLGQMIAMRYGALPIVRKTGGLADTVHDLTNGFIFEYQHPCELLNTIYRALTVYQKHPSWWQEMIHTAMSMDFSWATSAPLYIQMYEDALVETYPSEPVASP
jgi:starch synthase